MVYWQAFIHCIDMCGFLHHVILSLAAACKNQYNKIMVNIGNSWDEVLKEEFEKDYYLKLREFLKAEYGSRVIYPDMYDIFRCAEVHAIREGRGSDPRTDRITSLDRHTGFAFR